MQNELEKLKFQDDDLDVYIVEAKEVRIADESDQTLNDEIADDSDAEADLPQKVRPEDSDEEAEAPFDPSEPFVRCYKMKKTFLLQGQQIKGGEEEGRKVQFASLDRTNSREDDDVDEVVIVRNPMDR